MCINRSLKFSFWCTPVAYVSLMALPRAWILAQVRRESLNLQWYFKHYVFPSEFQLHFGCMSKKTQWELDLSFYLHKQFGQSILSAVKSFRLCAISAVCCKHKLQDSCKGKPANFWFTTGLDGGGTVSHCFYTPMATKSGTTQCWIWWGQLSGWGLFVLILCK